MTQHFGAWERVENQRDVGGRSDSSSMIESIDGRWEGGVVRVRFFLFLGVLLALITCVEHTNITLPADII